MGINELNELVAKWQASQSDYDFEAIASAMPLDSIANGSGWKFGSQEDAKQELLLVLLKACRAWNIQRGQFTTLFYSIWHNRLGNHRKSLGAGFRIPSTAIISLDAPLDDGGYIEPMGDSEPLEWAGSDKEQASTALSNLVESLPSPKREIMKLWLDGVVQKEIARMVGTSRQNVSLVIKTTEQRCRFLLPD